MLMQQLISMKQDICLVFYDYYDYEEGLRPDGGLGGADMMDYTVGDHNSFTKIILDWTTPLVVSGKNQRQLQ